MRHGETDWNKERRLQGRSDIPLNSCGIAMAETASEGMKEIPFDLAFTSPLTRAKQTAKILCQNRGIPVIEDERVIELSFGEEEGSYIEEVRKDPTNCLYSFLCSPSDYKPGTSAESFEQLLLRCESFLENAIFPLQDQYEHILVVAHGAFIRGMITYVEKLPFAEFWMGSPHKNCSVTIFQCENGAITLEEEGKCFE